MAAPRKYPDELRERAARLAVEARQDPDRKAGALQRIGEQLGITPGDAAQNNAPYGPLSEAHRTQSGAPHREQSETPEERCPGLPAQPFPFIRGVPRQAERPPHQETRPTGPGPPGSPCRLRFPFGLVALECQQGRPAAHRAGHRVNLSEPQLIPTCPIHPDSLH